MMSWPQGLSRSVALLALALSPALHAADGHHAIDDASTLAHGACKVDFWASKNRGDARGAHAGARCGVGSFELMAAVDREREDGVTTRSPGLQVKWARELRDGLSVGLSAAAGWQRGANPRYQGTTITGLATWEVSESIGVHANLGRNLARAAADETRGGVSADWTFHPQWQVMSERYRLDGGHFARAGLRWMPAKGWAVDASRAHLLRGTGASGWTLGLTREFE
jgi:hypothetical protein